MTRPHGLYLLATQLVKKKESKVVLLVDQFEEAFTLATDEAQRRHFFELLVTAVTEPRSPLFVILTLRADFYDRPMHYPELYRLIDDHHVSVLPMEREDLRRVIEEPANLPDVQLTFESGLVDELLFDMQGQSGALPLLEFTLDQLFQRRNGHQLTLQAYHEMGGVKGALSQHAEATYQALPSEEHRQMAREVFLRLVSPGATEQDTTRRRAAHSEFERADPVQTQRMQQTLETFIRARLLTTTQVSGTTTIEVSHEALIREWKRLAEWLREARNDILFQESLSEDVVEWEQRKRPRDRLYRGAQLKEAQAWARRNRPSEQEEAFLRASAARQILTLMGVIVMILLLLASIGITGWIRLGQPPDPTHVTNLYDDGWGSLRWDIANASSGSTIDASLMKGTIILTSGDITITKKLTIYGPGAQQLIISSRNNSDIRISQYASVDITGLSFTSSTFTVTKSFIINEGKLSLSKSIVSGNSVNQDGGGIHNDKTGTLTLMNSTVSDNRVSGASNYAGNGGGILNDGILTLINSTVSGNSASHASNSLAGSGGGIFSGGMLTLINSTVSDNLAGWDGGGIANYGTLTVTNSTIADNSAFHVGGGILNWRGKARITFCTIAHNKSFLQGGGVYLGIRALVTARQPLQTASLLQIRQSVVEPI